MSGEEMALFVGDINHYQDIDEEVLEAEIDRALLPFKIEGDAVDVNELRERLMDVMWECVGVLRTEDGIKDGIQKIEELRTDLLNSGIGSENRVFNLTWHDWINLYNLIEVSRVIAEACLGRDNSRGAHFREDFPEEGLPEDSYFTLVRNRHDEIEVTREPVNFSIIQPGESLIDGYTQTAPKVRNEAK